MPGTPWPGLTHKINHHYSQASLRISVFPSFIYRRRIKYELNDGFCGDCPGGSKTKQKRSEAPLSEHWERDVDSHQPNAEQRWRKLENECYGECHRVHGDSNEKMKMDASWSSANGSWGPSPKTSMASEFNCDKKKTAKGPALVVPTGTLPPSRTLLSEWVEEELWTDFYASHPLTPVENRHSSPEVSRDSKRA
ncbi:uncharacterized protein LOC102164422 isoform X2 [Sus scrofa]|uniref:uncharacterized protein LOC102164422 isoform X2 n=1 Tax=Sus scrofa TaxID=9823 RepID=UPI000A2B4D28|nr:uncharacterized protein LOC102164422 isoform X2 [Sus scrofa]XP_020919970.1 uncharacterized protein LOC102164422 isoform X2 [Sus scrofa]